MLIPAPVTTTTLRALTSALAIVWSASPSSGRTSEVGMAAEFREESRRQELEGEGSRHQLAAEAPRAPGGVARSLVTAGAFGIVSDATWWPGES